MYHDGLVASSLHGVRVSHTCMVEPDHIEPGMMFLTETFSSTQHIHLVVAWTGDETPERWYTLSADPLGTTLGWQYGWYLLRYCERIA